MLLQRLITSQKEEIMTMENYLKDVKSTIDWSKVVTILEDLLSLLKEFNYSRNYLSKMIFFHHLQILNSNFW
jgi:uncharacterized protein (DUF305 family)